MKASLKLLRYLVLIGLTCCSGSDIYMEPDNYKAPPEKATTTDKKPPEKERHTALPTDPLPDESKAGNVFQTGVASWYGGKFNGRRTANGEIYDMHKLTAAHKTLPFNTLVEVENQTNGHKVIVRINDRGPFVKNRIIDLSYKAAQRIDMDIEGTARVYLKIIRSTDVVLNKKIYTNNNNSNYFLQAGAFSEKTNAEATLARIERVLQEPIFSIIRKNGLHKVLSKGLTSRTKAEEIKRILENNNIDVFIREYF